MSRIVVPLFLVLLILAAALAVVFVPWDTPASGPTDRVTAADQLADLAPGSRGGAADADTELAAAGPERVAAPEPPWQGADLTGMVVDRHGEPIAGAEVRLSLEGRRQAALPDEHAVSLESVLAPRRTGADGRFRFDRLPLCGRYSAGARKSGFAPSKKPAASCLLSPGRTTDLGRIVLDPACRISGVVVSTEGRPLAGAQVHSLWTGIGSPAVTGDDGRFEIGDLEQGCYVLTASRTGFAPERRDQPVVRSLAAGEAWTGVRLVLARGRAVCGRVVSHSGTALPGARVSSSRRTGAVLFANGDTLGGWFHVDETRTDSGGRYVLTVPASPDEEFSIRVRADGYADTGVCLRAPAGIEPVGLPERILAPLTDDGLFRAAIDGRVLDGSGAGIPGARVDLAGPLNRRAWTFTAGDGAFRFERLEAGAYAVTGSTPGLVPVRVQDVQVGRDSGVTDLEIALREAAGALAGIVSGVDGAPRSGITLRARHAGGLSAEGESDAAGAFRIAPLAPGRQVVRIEPAEPFPTARSPDDAVDEPFELEVQIAAGVESDLRVDLRRSPYCAVEGTVRIRGKPAAGVEVAGARTDEAGWYRTGLFRSGDTRLVLERERCVIALRDLVTEPGTVHTVDFDLDPARLEIWVVDGVTGEPDCGAEVSMRHLLQDGSEGPFGYPSRAHSVDGGVVVFEAPAGRFVVEAETSPTVRNDLAPELAVIDLDPGGGREVVLRRYPCASLRVRLDPPPADPACVFVELRPAAGRTIRLDGGDFLPGGAAVRFERLSRGRYDVVVLDAESESELGAAEVTVHPREEAQVVIALKLGAGQR